MKDFAMALILILLTVALGLIVTAALAPEAFQ